MTYLGLVVYEADICVTVRFRGYVTSDATPDRVGEEVADAVEFHAGALSATSGADALVAVVGAGDHETKAVAVTEVDVAVLQRADPNLVAGAVERTERWL